MIDKIKNLSTKKKVLYGSLIVIILYVTLITGWMKLLLISSIFLLSYIYLTKNDVRLLERLTLQKTIPVITVKDEKTFKKGMYPSKTVKDLNKVYKYSSKNRHGVYATINYEELQENFTIKRKSDIRKKSKVRGYKGVSYLLEKDKEGKPNFIYHKTHLIPYRFCLNEESDVLITGTNHLNTGNRPDINYYVSEKEREERQQILSKKLSPLWTEDLIATNKPKGCLMSLDDLERYATHMINTNKRDMFTYGTIAYFEEGKDIADYVEVYFINNSKNSVIFKARIHNRK